MAFNITEFAGRLQGGGARSSLFEVRLETKGDLDIKDIAPFMCRGAQIPASTIASVEVPYFGRRIKIAGDRTFADWTVTIMNDEDFSIRNSMENWMNKINTHVTNLNEIGVNPSDYKVDAQVVQFGKQGNILATYDFKGMFPTEVSSIDLSWDAGADPQQFTVTFSYDWWQHANVTDGSNLSNPTAI